MRESLTTLSRAGIIELLGMERHPIRGWYSLHYSDHEMWARPKISSIYYLLVEDEPMPMHKLDSIEVWHHHAGAAMEMVVANSGGSETVSMLGPDFAAGQRTQLAIPAYFWRSMRTLSDWTLLGCTMSPGYSNRASVVVSEVD